MNVEPESALPVDTKLKSFINFYYFHELQLQLLVSHSKSKIFRLIKSTCEDPKTRIFFFLWQLDWLLVDFLKHGLWFEYVESWSFLVVIWPNSDLDLDKRSHVCTVERKVTSTKPLRSIHPFVCFTPFTVNQSLPTQFPFIDKKINTSTSKSNLSNTKQCKQWDTWKTWNYFFF